MQDPLRLALFLNGESMDRWQYRAVDHLLTEADVDVSLIVINEDPHTKLDESLSYYGQTLRSYWPWVPVWALHKITHAITGPPKQFESVELSAIDFANTTQQFHVDPVEESQYAVSFPDEAIATISAEADLGILFGFGILKGDILRAPTHGIVAYHHGDMRKYRGRPAGFWELLNGEDSVGITLQRLSPELDKGEIFAYEEISIGPSETWQKIQGQLYGDPSRTMLTRGVNNLLDPDFNPTTPESEGEVYTLPQRPATVLKYSYLNTVRRFR